MVDTAKFVPVVNEEQMQALGKRLLATFGEYEKDRKELEEQWLKNLRQFRGTYDPEIEKLIDPDRSKAYPKVTRTKVVGTVARLMEMLFPQTDRNFQVEPSPLPTLSQGDLQKVLDKLTEEAAAAGIEVTDEMIERGIWSFAKTKAERLQKEIDDQLDEIDYVTLARGVVFSAVLYGPGILKGPMVVEVAGRTWKKDPYTGKLTAVTVKKRQPYFERVPVWNWYPDLSAKSFESMDGSFERHVMSKPQILALTKRPDFKKEAIERYLAANNTGNFKERHWEQALRVRGDKSNITNLSGRKYELLEFWGHVTGHELAACGVNVPQDKLGAEVECNIWMIDNVVIKALLHPFNEKARMYHTFIYEEDDINLLGVGLPVVIRDSQLAIAEASRMILDNGSVVCGPMLEINTMLLMPGQKLDVHAYKTFLRDDTGADAQTPAVRPINIDSRIAELISVVDLFMQFADSETALPPPALGDTSSSGKEPYRTSSGTSMLLGAAALPIRDTVRNFDKFTVSFVGGVIAWNMEFNPDEKIKGDWTVIPRASTSLVAKEVRGVNLDQFLISLTPEEKMYLSTKKTLMERMKVRDLPMDILEEEHVVNDKLAENAKNAQANAAAQAEAMKAEIRGQVASAFKDLMLGLKAQAGANADTFNALVEGMLNVRDAGNSEGSGSGTPKPSVPATQRAGVKGAG